MSIVRVANHEPGSVIVASVAHEDVGGGPRTNVYCYLIVADPSGSTLTATLTGRATPTSLPGWLDEASLTSEIGACYPGGG